MRGAIGVFPPFWRRCFGNGGARRNAQPADLGILYRPGDPRPLDGDRPALPVHQVYYDSGDARDEVLADPNSNVDLVVDRRERRRRSFGRQRRARGRSTRPMSPRSRDYEPKAGASAAPATACPISGARWASSTARTCCHDSAHVLARPDAPAPALTKHVAMYDDHNEAFVAPLMLLGKSINANDHGDAEGRLRR